MRRRGAHDLGRSGCAAARAGLCVRTLVHGACADRRLRALWQSWRTAQVLPVFLGALPLRGDTAENAACFRTIIGLLQARLWLH